MTRSRESDTTGIYYGYELRDLLLDGKPRRQVRLYRWWEGIRQDEMFWKLMIYGGIIAFGILALTI